MTEKRLWPWLAAGCLLLLLSGAGSVRAGQAAPEWHGLISRLAADGYDRSRMEAMFARDEVQFDPLPMRLKMAALFRGKYAPRPKGKPLPAGVVYKGSLSRKRLAEAVMFMREHRLTLRRVHQAYGVPPEVVVAILSVETGLGRNTGHRCVFNTLAVMAACADLELLDPVLAGLAEDPDQLAWLRARSMQKADWAYNELRSLLDYAALTGRDPLSFRGSIYGAIGMCQFMPSNVLLYGCDGDGDGRVDVFDPADAVFSIANYLKAFGWHSNLPVSGRRAVVMEYNHSQVYANTVLAVASRIRR